MHREKTILTVSKLESLSRVEEDCAKIKEHQELNEKSHILSTMWKRMVDLSSESTAHGYQKIYNTSNAMIRFFWIIFFLSSTGFCVYLVIGSIRNFLKYEVTTKTRVKRSSSMTLPVITFCNYKPFLTASAIAKTTQLFLQLYGNGSMPVNDLSVLFGNYTNASDVNSFAFNPFYLNIIEAIKNALGDPDFNQTVQQSFGYSLNQFFIYFYLANRPVSFDHFTWFYDPNYGNCFKYNSGVKQDGSRIDLIKQTSAGYGNGVRSINFIDVFPAQAYSFMSLNSVTTTGLKFSIDDQYAMPLYYNKMIPAKPGSCTYINLKKTVTKNLPSPFSECHDLTYFHSELYDKFLKLNKTYSQNACFDMCKQKKVIETCQCASIYFLNPDKSRTCATLDETYCSKNLTLNESGCEEYCPLECESITYDFSTSFESYPDQYNYVVEKGNPVVIALFKAANMDLDVRVFDDLANSMTCVYIFYSALETTTIEEARAMSWVYFFFFLFCSYFD
jgi:hypothetical protein